MALEKAGGHGLGCVGHHRRARRTRFAKGRKDDWTRRTLVLFLFITFTGKLAELVLLRYILPLGLLVAGLATIEGFGN